MRFLFCLLPLLAAVSALDVDADAAKELFAAIVEEDGLDLDEYEYEDRLEKFMLNLLDNDGIAPINADLMFTEDELARANGARMIKGLRSLHSEELKKRGEDEYEEIYKRGIPPVYDGRVFRGRTAVNPVQHQMTCGNCYLHTFIAALEISYFRATGQLIKFSEQELTDCYVNECNGGDYRMLAVTMSYLDKLSPREVYGKYLDAAGTCRMDSTPDALNRIKVVDYVDVAAENAAAAVLKYGSVMTCMKWDSLGGPCDMNGYSGGVVNDKPTVDGGCDHAVLIVGYTPAYWIVRNSHGTDWGEGGYFKIARGKNMCGIEQGMAALIVENRAAPKGNAPNGCPADKPNYCPGTKSCTSSTRCLGLEEEVEIEEREDWEDWEDVAMDSEEVELEKREVRVPGEEREKRDIRIPGKLARMLEKRGVSEEALAEYYAFKRSDEQEEEVEKRACADKMKSCAKKIAKHGKGAVCGGGGAAQCAVSCGICATTNTDVNKPSKEPASDCVAPTIANGMTRGPVVKYGKPLQIRCNDGYTLVGNDNPTCLVQDVFTNDDHDGRLKPECIKLGDSTLSGNGAGYDGPKNTYEYNGNSFECDSWNKDVLRGILQDRKDGMRMAIGNHNYCRNPGGMEPVPFCIGTASGVGKVHYCFKGPGCNTCAGAVDSDAGFCGSARTQSFCSYKDINTKATVQDIQAKCPATCCRINGC